MAGRRAPRIGTVGLVVEGPTEFDALRQLHTLSMIAGCPPLKPTNLNGVGEDVDELVIARRVLPKVIAHQAAGRNHVVVCFDRERRQTTGPRLERDVLQQLRRLLRENGRREDGVSVVVADRAFEAWLLADALGLFTRAIFTARPTFFCFEGELGQQAKLGTVELDQLLGREYSKTRDGPRLFAKLDVAAARDAGTGKRGSASFNRFLEAVGV